MSKCDILKTIAITVCLILFAKEYKIMIEIISDGFILAAAVMTHFLVAIKKFNYDDKILMMIINFLT